MILLQICTNHLPAYKDIIADQSFDTGLDTLLNQESIIPESELQHRKLKALARAPGQPLNSYVQ